MKQPVRLPPLEHHLEALAKHWTIFEIQPIVDFPSLGVSAYHRLMTLYHAVNGIGVVVKERYV